MGIDNKSLLNSECVEETFIDTVQSDDSSHVYEVIIIGAGISGVGAGNQLLKQGISDFCLLEAQSLAGGRIQSFGNATEGFLDYGAQWIHGEAPQNSVHCAIREADLVHGDVMEIDGGGEFYSETGQKLTDDQRLLNALDAFAKMNEDIFEEEFTPCKYSVEEYFRLEYEKFLKDKCPGDHHIFCCFSNWMQRWERVDNACHSMKTLSAVKWQDYKLCDGKRNITPKNGMISIFNQIAARLMEKITLNAEVTGIQFKELYGTKIADLDDPGRRPVSVLCENGKVYRCNHVIVTCSLGFLKHNLHIFEPPLPKKLEIAIQTHGYGNIGKIFLEFDTKWWNWKDKSLQLIWTDDLPQFNDPTETNPWWKSICGFNEVCERKNTLVAWIGGDECATMECLPMDEVTVKLVEMLSAFTNKTDIPLPVNTYRSTFSTNEYFHGGYSHSIYANDNEDIIGTLNKPVYGRYTNLLTIPYLTFAGEANSVNSYSTIHGALDNGTQQALIYCNWRKNIQQN